MVSQGKALARSAQELLEDYVRTGSQAPFEEVVRRYAGMVFNVCYQVLKDSHDAEDATQAVFLALAVQAKTANGVKYLAPWLQKVAQRLSLDVRRSKTRRKAREERHSQMRLQMGIENDPTRQPGMDELKIILRDELDKLPSKYRLPLVLHYFGGLKPEEISKELGCKPSTLGVRLHRGRKMLGDLLSERGIIVNSSMLTVALATCVQMRISETLIHSTAHAAGAYAAQGSFATAVTPQVFGFNRIASHGILLAKVKAAVTAGILAAAAAAGAAELVSRVAPESWKLNFRTELRQWLKPSFEHIVPRLQVDAKPIEDNTFAAAPAAVFADFNFPQTPVRAPEAETQQFTANAAIAVASAPATTDLRDTPYGSESTSSSSDSNGVGLATPVARTTSSASRNDALIQASIDAALASSGGGSGGGGSTSAIAQHAVPAAPPAITIARNPNGTAKVPAQAFLPSGSSENISIGARPGDVSNFVYDKPGKVTAEQLNVGGEGVGTLTAQNGTISIQQGVKLGSGFGGQGVLVLKNNATLYAPTVEVGADGVGSLTIKGAASVNTNALTVGSHGIGSVELQGGTVQSKSFYVGLYDKGTVNQTGGATVLSGFLGNVGALQLGVSAGSEGTYNQFGGTLDAGLQIVGARGDGNVFQNNGLNNATCLVLGADAGGLGSYHLPGGLLQFNRSQPGAPVKNELTVGDQGRGSFMLGDRNGVGTIAETGMGEGTDLVIRASDNATGQFVGYGRVMLTGSLIQNGQVIAEGFGRSQTLDFSSFADILNTIDNKHDEQNGWYARNGGKLILPLHRDSQPGSLLIDSYTFGEGASDPAIDLVNSVRFVFNPKLDDSMPVSLSLVSLGNEAVPATPADDTFATIYETNFGSLPLESVNLTIRYDAVSVGDSTPRLLAWINNGWEPVLSSDLHVDFANHLIVASTAPSNFYAVAVPEPLSSGLLLVSASLLLGRRRRQV